LGVCGTGHLDEQFGDHWALGGDIAERVGNSTLVPTRMLIHKIEVVPGGVPTISAVSRGRRDKAEWRMGRYLIIKLGEARGRWESEICGKVKIRSP
jgi:hypothetical protein